MSDINISVEGGESKRLLTAGKYCDRDIVVTASGGGGVVNIIEAENPTKADLGNFTQLGKESFSNAESILRQ